MAEHWPKEWLQKLRELSKTMTMSQVAAEMSMSRNSIAGKASRHGISFKKDKLQKEEAALEESRDRRTKLSLVILGNSKKVQKPLVGMYLIDANDNDCRWPLDKCNNLHLCCGKKVVAGSPYCSQHRALAYKPMKKVEETMQIEKPHKQWSTK